LYCPNKDLRGDYIWVSKTDRINILVRYAYSAWVDTQYMNRFRVLDAARKGSAMGKKTEATGLGDSYPEAKAR